MWDVRSFLSALLAAAPAGVMAACTGGGASYLTNELVDFAR